MQKTIGLLFIIFLTIACKQSTNHALLLGTWRLPASSPDSSVRITFLPTKIIVNQTVHEQPRRTSTDYILSNDEKYIIPVVKDGGDREKMEIYQLTKKELIFIRRKDTARLIRE